MEKRFLPIRVFLSHDGKAEDRWTPRSNQRPIKSSVYVGVSECNPDIEGDSTKEKYHIKRAKK